MNPAVAPKDINNDTGNSVAVCGVQRLVLRPASCVIALLTVYPFALQFAKNPEKNGPFKVG